MTYLAQVINSTLREITPILLVALCAGVCSKVQVFNIALEGTLLMSAFFAFLTHYFIRNIFLSVGVAMLVAMTMTFIMSFFIVKLKGQPMIVGMALNTFARGFTTLLLSVIFHTKGFGHGVGMSQAGANGMATDGADYRTILLHYYTGVTIGVIGQY